MDHRAVEHVGDGSPIAPPRPAGEAGAGTRRGRLVHDRGAERRAALPGRAEAAEQRALDGQVEVGVGHHDQRVLAAQLEAGRLQVAPAQLADARADVGRAGEADLVDQPLVERPLEPRERRLGRRTARGSARRRAGPPARKSSASASPSAGAYSAGFQTTALPHSSAGTRYHDGTATGKLPAVMIAATPTGSRNVKSCLSGISLGTVWPYRRRPSPRKKSQVSMTSCTSPSAPE